MSNQKPEHKIKEKCLKFLEMWKERGVVIDYDDVSSLGRYFNPYSGVYVMKTKKGKRDLIAWIRVGKSCLTYLIEVKSDVGVQKKEQKDYESKFLGLDGVIYEVVSNPSQVNITVERLSGYGEELLKLLPESVG